MCLPGFMQGFGHFFIRRGGGGLISGQYLLVRGLDCLKKLYFHTKIEDIELTENFICSIILLNKLLWHGRNVY